MCEEGGIIASDLTGRNATAGKNADPPSGAVSSDPCQAGQRNHSRVSEPVASLTSQSVDHYRPDWAEDDPEVWYTAEQGFLYLDAALTESVTEVVLPKFTRVKIIGMTEWFDDPRGVIAPVSSENMRHSRWKLITEEGCVGWSSSRVIKVKTFDKCTNTCQWQTRFCSGYTCCFEKGHCTTLAHSCLHCWELRNEMVNDRTVHVGAAFPYSTGYRVSQVPCFGVFHSGPWKRDYGLAQALALRGWYIKEWNIWDYIQNSTYRSMQRCLHEEELRILTWAHIVPPRLDRSSIESATSIEREGVSTSQLSPEDPAIEVVALSDSLEAFL